MTVIQKGWGFDVGCNFTRATKDIPIVIDHEASPKPGHIYGTITGDPNHALGFMRDSTIYVHVSKQALSEKEHPEAFWITDVFPT